MAQQTTLCNWQARTRVEGDFEIFLQLLSGHGSSDPQLHKMTSLDRQWFTLEKALETGATVSYNFVVLEDGKEKTILSSARSFTSSGFELFIDDGVLPFPHGVHHPAETVNEDRVQLHINLGRVDFRSRKDVVEIVGNEINTVPDRFTVSVRLLDSSKQRFVWPSNGSVVEANQTDGIEEIVVSAPHLQDLNVAFHVKTSDGLSEWEGLVLAEAFQSKWGDLSIPVLSKGDPKVGRLNLSYLVVEIAKSDRFFSDQPRLFSKWERLVRLGHRGSGSNVSVSQAGQGPLFCENTILSFNEASKKGTKFVEFDVSVTYDGVPVIYHNYTVPLKIKDGNTLNLPIYTLTLREFKTFSPTSQGETEKTEEEEVDPSEYTSKYSNGKNKKQQKHNDHFETPQDRYMPTLQQLFEQVVPETGFDVEIKYANSEEVSHMGLGVQPERNSMLHPILQVVFDHVKDRNIFFSSFDAEICRILLLKQSRFPVFFLTTGIGDCHCDPRRTSLMQGARFAQLIGAQGVVTNSKAFLADADTVLSSDVHKKRRLLYMTYGSRNNNPEKIQAQADKGLDGVVSDHESHISSSSSCSSSV